MTACSDFFQKSERAHSAVPPLQTGPAALGSGLVLAANLTATSFLAPQPRWTLDEHLLFQRRLFCLGVALMSITENEGQGFVL